MKKRLGQVVMLLAEAFCFVHNYELDEFWMQKTREQRI